MCIISYDNLVVIARRGVMISHILSFNKWFQTLIFQLWWSIDLANLVESKNICFELNDIVTLPILQLQYSNFFLRWASYILCWGWDKMVISYSDDGRKWQWQSTVDSNITTTQWIACKTTRKGNNVYGITIQ